MAIYFLTVVFGYSLRPRTEQINFFIGNGFHLDNHFTKKELRILNQLGTLNQNAIDNLTNQTSIRAPRK